MARLPPESGHLLMRERLESGPLLRWGLVAEFENFTVFKPGGYNAAA